MMLSKEQILKKAKLKFNCRGVYFLIKNNEIIYIGSSINIYGRLVTHYNSIDFDSHSFIKMNMLDKKELRIIEAEYILKYLPKHNCKLPVNNKYEHINKNLPKELIRIDNENKILLLRKKGIEITGYVNKTKFGERQQWYILIKDRGKVYDILRKTFIY